MPQKRSAENLRKAAIASRASLEEQRRRVQALERLAAKAEWQARQTHLALLGSVVEQCLGPTTPEGLEGILKGLAHRIPEEAENT